MMQHLGVKPLDNGDFKRHLHPRRCPVLGCLLTSDRPLKALQTEAPATSLTPFPRCLRTSASSAPRLKRIVAATPANACHSMDSMCNRTTGRGPVSLGGQSVITGPSKWASPSLFMPRPYRPAAGSHFMRHQGQIRCGFAHPGGRPMQVTSRCHATDFTAQFRTVSQGPLAVSLGVAA
jgi:hypothetical protein